MVSKNNKIKKLGAILGMLVLGGTLLMPMGPAWAVEETLVSTEKAALGAGGKKDPFKPFVETATEVTRKSREKGVLPISPLQRQDLSAFNLVGISGNDRDGWRAIVEDGERKFYPIAEGTLIGLDQGRVTSIKSDRVIVAVKQDDGKGRTNYITILLHKDIEETP